MEVKTEWAIGGDVYDPASGSAVIESIERCGELLHLEMPEMAFISPHSDNKNDTQNSFHWNDTNMT